MTIQKPPQKSKKSETLEVRIPYETKQAFLTACRQDGTTASEVVRGSVQTYLDERERPSQPEKRTLVMKFPEPVRRYGLRAAAGSVVAVGLAAFVVLPSAANPDFRSQFKTYDKNADGVISSEEFLAARNGSADNKDATVETRITTRSSSTTTEPSAAVKPEIKQEAYSFWLPDEISGGGPSTDHQAEYKFVSHREVREIKDGDGADTTADVPAPFNMEDMRKQEFLSFDTDKDGKVSLGEFEARQRAMLTRGFEILDANSDKALSQDEYARIVSPPMIMPAGVPDMPKTPPIEIPGRAKISDEALKATFTKLDANKDSRLSLQEYLPTS